MDWNKTVTEFFDRLSEKWDLTNTVKKETADRILSYAGITKGKSVLDAGCGTGVMLPFYIENGVSRICAVDISPEMLKIAKKKYNSGNIDFVLADVAEYSDNKKYDCVMVHNAFPHFTDMSAALDNLKTLVKSGGTLTVAHSISREKVLECHKNIPDISHPLPQTADLAAMFGDDFTDIQIVSDDEIFLVTGVKLCQTV